MGKNQKHKKELRAEKAKVKLKQSKTKFLPKGQNITNTVFNIKPIVIPEQLKQKDPEDVLSKRQLNIKEIILRLKHHNGNVRHGACEELTEFIKIHSDELIAQHYVYQVCRALSVLMLDREKKVRKAAVKCTEVIVQFVPSEKLEGCYDILCNQLRCAMTHIDNEIHEDSLLFLDCFIRSNCALISKTLQKLLPDFLSLISKFRRDSIVGRTLTLNMGSKMTSVAWRISVLSRLHAIFSIIISDGEKRELEKIRSDSLALDATKSIRISLYKADHGRHLEEVTLKEVFEADNTTDTLKRYIVTLIPLLYETWMEVMPERKVHRTEGEMTVLNDEASAVLTCITYTLYLSWQYVRKVAKDVLDMETVFMTREGQKFLTTLLSQFPYSHSGKNKNCVRENLLLCFMYSVLMVNHTQRNLKHELGKIFAYINKIVFSKASVGKENGDCIVELLKECFGVNYAKWSKSGMDLNMVLETAVGLYSQRRLKNENKLQIFNVLTEIYDREYFGAVRQSLSITHTYKKWVTVLPNALLEPEINDTTILALLNFAKKNSKDFHEALLARTPEILDNLSKLKIVITQESLLCNEETAKRNLAYIYYYLPPRSNLDCISKFVESQEDWGGFKKYFEEVLMHRGH